MEGNVKTNRFIREKAPKSDREVIKRNTDITRKKSRAILISGKKVSEIKTVRNFEASEIFTVQYKGSGKRGHIVANALLPTQMFPRLPARETFVADTKYVFDFVQKHCVRNKCFPVCAAQETSWVTMCPQQCVLVYQGLKDKAALSIFFPVKCLLVIS